MDKSRFKTARPVARLREGRSDWYRVVENKAAASADVYIYDEIGYFGVTAQDFARDFKAITAPEITLHLDTPGGDVFDAVNIYNTIADHPSRVTTVVDSLAASAGSFILQAGDHRVMNRHSTVMIHNGHTAMAGDAASLRKQAELLDKITGTIANIYSEKSGKEPQFWLEAMATETWYTAEEAIEAGLADEVIISSEKLPANSFDLSIFSYAGRDQAPPPVIPVTPEPEADPYQGVDFSALRDALKGAFL